MARLYVPIETPGNNGHYRQIRVYDTATWVEVERTDLDFDGYAGTLAVDSDGNLYGVEWFSESESRVWKREATTGATTTVSVAASEVRQVLWAAGS